ncbi:MAG: hypothetical protein IKV35_06765, partial [Clostridia bacterium]|nr:hypothetical protein [Clostridia bacterium]
MGFVKGQSRGGNLPPAPITILSLRAKKKKPKKKDTHSRKAIFPQSCFRLRCPKTSSGASHVSSMFSTAAPTAHSLLPALRALVLVTTDFAKRSVGESMTD